MRGLYRFNLLVLALLAIVSYCTARTIITLPDKCTTRYCVTPVTKVYKIVKIWHTTGRYTVTRWKTSTKYPKTKTVTATKKITSTIHKTVSKSTTFTARTTIWETLTLTSTNWVTVATATLTLPITTLTTRPLSYIPAPSGFVGVNDDPDNLGAASVSQEQRRNVEPEPTPGPKPRNAEPEPKPVAAKHITAITCTRTILTKTGTSDLWKTKTKTMPTPTKTVWKTETYRTTKTTTKTVGTTSYSSIRDFTLTRTTVTATIGTTAYKYLTTTTEVLPLMTVYAACMENNHGPPPAVQFDYYAIGAEAYPNETTKVIYSNGSTYDCCVACLTYAGPEVCLGSVYNYQGQWGGPECPGGWEECPPWEPEFHSRCQLVLAPDAPGNCRTHSYGYEWYMNQPPTVVFNGPSCKRFKWTG
ncbi:hypothetical protein TWF730_010052 [Orbilia blumenaviensis]|uniref:Uncharacterized protein n=1 Tax=Orbilia blumenaviensis TaxID=1796055 RepID=A0AAV9UTN9_9PEZI